ncbi:MAG: CFI-box-CTERM domain-containing protein [Promethearchaeota archaeon]
MDFTTIESEIIYSVDHGRVNPINITEGNPTLPSYPPTETEVDWGNVVIKWNLNRQNSDEIPNKLELHLLKPKASVADPYSILNPPEYLGHGERGNYTVRFPAGDDTFPTKEHSPLWQDYVEPNWEPVQGAWIEHEQYVQGAERDNTEWPGDRMGHRFTFDLESEISPVVVPLRVAKSGVNVDGEPFLLFLEIRRYGRLRLYARPVIINPIIGKCFIATAAYGDPLHLKLDILRGWRDESLGKTSFGNSIIKLYYKLSPPFAGIITRSNVMRKVIRKFINLFIDRIQH